MSDNQAIFIDSSSTASFLAPYLAKLNHVIVITNGLRIAVALDGLPSIKTFLTGGRLRNGSGSILGDDSIAFLSNFRANLFLCHALAWLITVYLCLARSNQASSER